MPGKLTKLYGTDVPEGKRRVLNAGPMTAVFDNGSLRNIRYQGFEVLRAVSYLVRDENWGTCLAPITGLKIRKTKSGTEVTFASKASNRGATLSINAHFLITPRQITATVRATPDKDLLTNRTGFVVLHPINGVANMPLAITHTDGKMMKSKFPKVISPGQPFFEIRALEHSPTPGLKAHVLMEGNKFEMEDHRNWMDASYKTYVCSLLDPWPYTLVAGKEFEQKITLTIKGKAKGKAKPDAATVELKGKLPEIGFAVPMAEAEATLKRAAEIKKLNPSHLMCVLDGSGNYTAAAQTYAKLAAATEVPIALEIILPAKASAQEEVNAITSAVRAAGLKPDSIIITQAHDLKSFQPGAKRPWGPSYEEMAEAARAHFPGVKLGGGMQSFFTELNRKRPPFGVFDFLTHSVCPIVHDASDEAVMQTLEALPHIFTSGKALIGKTPYHLGPSSIGARMNPYGADVVANPKALRNCLSSNDPRQFGQFAAAWNLGLIAACTKAKLKRITLCSITGPLGLFDGKGRPTALHKLMLELKQGKVNWIGSLTPKPQIVKRRKFAPYEVRRQE